MFAAPDGTELRVGMLDEVEESNEGSTELHGYRRSMRFCGLVEQRPFPVPGMVGEQSGSAILFIFDRSRPDHELSKFSDELVGQQHPELALNEVGHFLS